MEDYPTEEPDPAYAELFDLAKSLSDAESDRATRIDGKAFRLLSLVTFLLGIIVVFCRFGLPEIIPPSTILEISAVCLIFGSAVMLLVAGGFFIWAVKLEHYQRIDLDIEAFSIYSLDEVRYAYAEQLDEATRSNMEKVNTKAWRVAVGLNILIAAVSILVIGSLFYLIIDWTSG